MANKRVIEESVEILEAETTGQEAEANEAKLFEVPLGSEGDTVKVLPVKKWKSSAVHALRTGDIEIWASTALTPESYEIWQDVDPDLDEIEDFFDKWSSISGSASTTSRSQRRASKRMRTR